LPYRSYGANATSGAGRRASAPGDERRFLGLLRVPGGCLFWIVVSVVLSVTLTVLVNLVLYLL
jgi:hypothetical protein